MTVVSVKRHRFDGTKKYYLYPTSKQDRRSPNIILKTTNIVDKKYVDVVVDTLFCCVLFCFLLFALWFLSRVVDFLLFYFSMERRQFFWYFLCDKNRSYFLECSRIVCLFVSWKMMTGSVGVGSLGQRWLKFDVWLIKKEEIDLMMTTMWWCLRCWQEVLMIHVARLRQDPSRST
jgi:hypothetical protein